METRDTIPNYIAENSRVGQLNADGLPQLENDQKALRSYFLDNINQNTVFFHSLKEKLGYLVENNYYDKAILDQYSFEDIKALFKYAYSFKFRFKSFIGALKFYQTYALQTNDGSRYLERYEDRVVANALLLARGDVDLARAIIAAIITNQFQTATPTFINSMRSRGGELVSCFLIRMEDNMESIGRGITSSLQLSRIGGGVALVISNLREDGSPIKGIEGRARGPIPVMKLLEDAFGYADQLGTRAGAGAVYASVHHMDISSILDTKRENADEKVRIKTLSLGVVLTASFWKAWSNGQRYYTFSTYDLEKHYGKGLADIDIDAMYDTLVADTRIRKKTQDPEQILDQMAQISGESGYPYILNQDIANAANPLEGWINMSNLCVTGDTRILTDKGYRRAKDLYDSQEDFDVLVDKRARDMSTFKFGLSQESSTKMFKTAENAQIFKLTLNNGMEIRSTAWHKYYVKRGSQIVKIPLTEMEIGDQLLIQSGVGSFGITHQPSLAYLAGVLTADGTVASSGDSQSAKFYLYGDKRHFEGRVEKAIANALQGREDLCERRANTTPSFVCSEDPNLQRSELSSAPLFKLFKENGWDISVSKHEVPEFVMSGDYETQKAYIDGLFSLDASVVKSSQSGYLGIEISSINKRLLQDVQIMLINMGVETSIYKGRQAGTYLLPDGQGGMKAYDCNALYSLRSSNSSREVLYGLVDWLPKADARWGKWVEGRVKGSYFTRNRFLSSVVTIEEDGFEDVYDVTVDNGNSVVFNGIATGQCTEILQISEASELNPDNTYKHLGSDISCNLGSLNVYELMHRGEFGRTVNVATRALTSVSDLSSIDVVPSVKKGNEELHAIGLGVMNFHGFIATEGIDYASEEAIDFADQFFMLLNYHSLRASCSIAKERGVRFKGFENSKYASGDYFDYYMNRDLEPKTEKVRAIFEKFGIQLPGKMEWLDVKEDVMAYGLYNAYRIAVAPTGSISYVNYATSSLHPIAMRLERRDEGKLGSVYAPAPYMNLENLKYYRNAYEIGNKAIVDVYAAATPHVDQGLSLTTFYTTGATTGDVKSLYAYGYLKGVKTMYYVRTQKEELEGTAFDSCIACEI